MARKLDVMYQGAFSYSIYIEESFLLAGGIFSADAGDDRHDSVIYDFVYMKVALEVGFRRETMHEKSFSEIVSMKITL